MVQGTNDSLGLNRRQLLQGAAGLAASAAVLPGLAAAQTDIDDWLSDTGNYDGTVVDRLGEAEVTIQVGAQGNGGAFAFEPPAVQVDPGTTIIWEWTGEGGLHNVNAMEGADFQSETTDEAGFTFEQTLEEEGVVLYQCDPHVGVGMKGAVVVGDVPTPAGGDGDGGDGEQPDWGNWFTEEANGGADDTYDGTTVDLRGEDQVTVGVGTEGNGDYFAFDPSAIWIDPGTTVTFEWTGRGGGHNVVSEAGPADLDSGDPIAEAGVHYEYTFEETGINLYYCVPHLALGMKGGIAVGDDIPMAGADGAPPADGAPADGGRPLPGGDFGATFLGAILGIAGLAITAVLAGETYRWYRSRSAEAAGEPAEPTVWTGVVRELDHDEFEPTGTAWLVALYFLILLVMWVFIYFVEFLGGGPTVIG